MSRRLGPTPERETRTVTQPVRLGETRADGGSGSTGPGTSTGYAAVFNSPSQIMTDYWYGPFREVMVPGCFAGAIERDDIRCLQDHLPQLILGRNTAGTLRLQEDETGLDHSCDLPDTTTGRDLATSMRRGDVTNMSFNFGVINGAEEWSEDADGMPLRRVLETRLFDVSIVTYPAYLASVAEVRSLVPTLEQLVATTLDEDRRAVAFPELRSGASLTDENAALVRGARDALSGLLEGAPTDAVLTAEQRRSIASRGRDLDLLAAASLL